MGRASIFISISISIFFLLILLLLLIYHAPTQHLRHRHRRLRLRFRFRFNPPLAPAAEEFIDDGASLNVTERLLYIFPKIDVDPPDGFVSAEELARWNLHLAMDEALLRTQREFHSHDENRDGFVSFSEYEPPSNGSLGHDLGWWNEEHFNTSNANGDGVLNITEYNDFLHPVDSKSPKLLLWLCADVVREKDADKDGKLNFSEFFHGIFDVVRKNDENYHLSIRDDAASKGLAKKIFSDLDKDYDGYLSAAELWPVIGKIHLSESYYAKQQAEYIISQVLLVYKNMAAVAMSECLDQLTCISTILTEHTVPTIFGCQVDSDDDGLITLNDMIENPSVFYSTVFSEDEMDYYPNFVSQRSLFEENKK